MKLNVIVLTSVTIHPGLSRTEEFPEMQDCSANTGEVPGKPGQVGHPNLKQSGTQIKFSSGYV